MYKGDNPSPASSDEKLKGDVFVTKRLSGDSRGGSVSGLNPASGSRSPTSGPKEGSGGGHVRGVGPAALVSSVLAKFKDAAPWNDIDVYADKDKRYIRLSKRANNVVFERLNRGNDELKAKIEGCLPEFVSNGLRTLTLA